MNTTIKHISWMHSKFTQSRVAEYSERGFQDYAERFKCSVCSLPNARWATKPVPIDIEVERQPKGCIDQANAHPQLLSHSLYEILRPYLRNALFGKCVVAERSQRPRDSGYVTVCSPPIRCIDAHRGPNCRHRRCPGTCGRFYNQVGWADGGVVRRDLDDRRVYQDHDGLLYIDEALVGELDLKRKFPDLRLYRYKILDEPLDGDTLPGDPGWNGVFVERPLPQLPPGNPPKGRCTW